MGMDPCDSSTLSWQLAASRLWHKAVCALAHRLRHATVAGDKIVDVLIIGAPDRRGTRETM